MHRADSLKRRQKIQAAGGKRPPPAISRWLAVLHSLRAAAAHKEEARAGLLLQLPVFVLLLGACN